MHMIKQTNKQTNKTKQKKPNMQIEQAANVSALRAANKKAGSHPHIYLWQPCSVLLYL